MCFFLSLRRTGKEEGESQFSYLDWGVGEGNRKEGIAPSDTGEIGKRKKMREQTL